MSELDLWLPNPPDGTSVAGGFDGSENDDFTAIKLETREGFIFTPRYGPDRKPTIWNPADYGGRIPRAEVHVAWEEICRRYDVVRVHCDPGFRDESSWVSEIDTWDATYGPKKFLSWRMDGSSRVEAVYKMLRRFESDLDQSLITQDGCPITTTHMGNARRIAKSGDRYGLGKPAQTQKIDAAVTTALAHEAACDARAAGWVEHVPTRIYTASSTRRRR